MTKKDFKETLKEVKETIATTETIENTKSVNLPRKDMAQRKTPLFNSKNWAERVPEHMRNLVYILRNNTEIRRFTAIGIINYLLQKGEISGEKRFVNFMWNKFQVKVDGIVREFKYTEDFFINCLVASFASFSASAQRTINEFTETEMNKSLSEAADSDEVRIIAEQNENYTASKDVVE